MTNPAGAKPAPRWPLLVWSAQLVAPAALLAYAALRLSHGLGLGALGTLGAGLGLLWTGAVLGVAVSRRGRAWIVTRRRELLLSFASVLVTAALADAALSWTGRIPSFAELYSRYALHYRDSVFTLGRLAPNQVLAVPEGPRLEINGRGFRGPEIAVPKPAGTYRIVFLGGSQVFDQHGENWPLEVGRLLATESRPVDVVNAGVPSHRTADSIGKCLTELWMLEPDAFVVCQAWNDLKYFTRLTPSMPYRDLFRPRPGDWQIEPSPADRILGVSAVYRLARTRWIRLTHGEGGERFRREAGHIQEWGPQQYRLDLELLCDLAKNLGATPVLCTQARLPVAGGDAASREKTAYDYVGLDHAALVDAFDLCDRIVGEVGAKKGAHVVDMNRVLSGRSEWFADHIHFNPDGSREAARLVAAELRRLGIPDAAGTEPRTGTGPGR